MTTQPADALVFWCQNLLQALPADQLLKAADNAENLLRSKYVDMANDQIDDDDLARVLAKRLIELDILRPKFCYSCGAESKHPTEFVQARVGPALRRTLDNLVPADEG